MKAVRPKSPDDRPVVMWDIDGVLADFTLGFTELANGLYPSIPVNGTSVQKFWQFTGQSSAWTKEKETACWKWIQKSDSFWYNLSSLLVRADQLAMGRLAKVFDFQYVTGRFGEDSRNQTTNWLMTMGVPRPFGVTLLGDQSRMNKGAIAKRFRARFAIDDAPRYLEEIDKNGPEDLVLFRRRTKYNESVEGGLMPGIPVDSVEEFCEEVLERWNSNG